MKTKEEARANLEASVAYIGPRYITGVGRADWATPAGSEAAEKNYADAVARAVANKTRQAGVKRVSNSEWQRLAIDKGGAIIGERVRGAIDKQAARWGPIYDRVVSDVARMTPRTIDFRANVTNRVLPTVEAWKKHSGKL